MDLAAARKTFGRGGPQPVSLAAVFGGERTRPALVPAAARS